MSASIKTYAKAITAILDAGYEMTYKHKAHFLQKNDEILMLYDKSAVCLFANYLYEKSYREPLKAPRRDA